MKITVTDSTTLLPSSETPQHRLWISTLDNVIVRSHLPIVFFYRPDGSNNFFDPKVMKESLGKALVLFYPIAGRLRHSESGRLEIDCNAQGVLFVEAVADGRMDDFKDFSPSKDLEQLSPSVDYTADVSSYPFLLLQQITLFKCRGVCLALAIHHTVADGFAEAQFLISWSEIARGMDVKFPPIISRTCLRARDPPTPMFDHTELQSPPTMKTPSPVSENTHETWKIFKFTKDHLARLSHMGKVGEHITTKLSSFELLAGHLWRCISIIRGLEHDQKTILYIMVDGRSRLRPEIPNNFFGNVVSVATPIAVAGDLMSKPSYYAASKVHEAVSKMNDAYWRSMLDYLELQPDLNALVHQPQMCNSPNVKITSWLRLPFNEVNFGWGKPIYAGPGSPTGSIKLLPSPYGDGSIWAVIGLNANQLSTFEKLIYQVSML